MAPRYAKDQPAGFKNAIERIAIIGVGGTIGSFLTQQLLATGKHTVTALQRSGSKATVPEGVNSITVDYDDEASIISALEGQQVLIITLSVQAPPGTQSKIIAAAGKSSVEIIMPNAWGPYALNWEAMNSIYLGQATAAAIKQVEEIPSASAWMIMSCGFWYEHSMAAGVNFFGIDAIGKEVVLIGDAKNTKQNTSTLAQCGRGLAAFFNLKWLPEDENDQSPTISQYYNTCWTISSFLVSQQDMFESAKRVTGTTDADWKISHEDAVERFKAAQLAMSQGGGLPAFARQMYTRFFYDGSPGAYELTVGTLNKVLGLPVEDLDEATRLSIKNKLENNLGAYST